MCSARVHVLYTAKCKSAVGSSCEMARCWINCAFDRFNVARHKCTSLQCAHFVRAGKRNIFWNVHLTKIRKCCSPICTLGLGGMHDLRYSTVYAVWYRFFLYLEGLSSRTLFWINFGFGLILIKIGHLPLTCWVCGEPPHPPFSFFSPYWEFNQVYTPSRLVCQDMTKAANWENFVRTARPKANCTISASCRSTIEGGHTGWRFACLH